jgi:choline transport protein
MSTENLLSRAESSDRAPSLKPSTAGGAIDGDDFNLAGRSDSQPISRNRFSIWSVLGVGFSLTNSWFGVSASLVAGINSGGPVLLVYGIIIVGVVSICVGISLAELASAMPNAGGQYFWASELASEDWAQVASYATGWFAWAGSIFTSASVALAMGSALTGCYQLSHPDFEIKTWQVLVVYQLVNVFCFTFNCWGNTLPKVAQMTLYISLISFLTILITVPATAETHQSAKFVFATFINNTGWKSSGIAYVVGLVNANWAFACLDCATHLAEEVHKPERIIPIAIMGTVAIGFITSWFYSISMFFSIVGDFQEIVTTPTLVPILELYHRALNSVAGAIALESLIIATGFGCLIASHTWQSRLCWSFARDRGVPGSKWLSQIHPRLDVPLNAHMVSCLLVAIVGCLYLASYTAFNSMATACIVLLYISYSIPVICLLLHGRENIKHGPFWLGRLGLVANVVLLGWTAFTLVMYSLPYTMPVRVGNMNYVSLVYAVVCIIVASDWFLRGRREYKGQQVWKQDADVEVRRTSSYAS